MKYVTLLLMFGFVTYVALGDDAPRPYTQLERIDFAKKLMIARTAGPLDNQVANPGRFASWAKQSSDALFDLYAEKQVRDTRLPEEVQVDYEVQTIRDRAATKPKQ